MASASSSSRKPFPTITRVAVIANPTFDAQRYGHHTAALRTTASQLKVEVQRFQVKRKALRRVACPRRPQVLDPNRSEIVAMANKQRLPAMYWWRFFVEAGGVMAYGESIPGFHYRSASYVSQS